MNCLKKLLLFIFKFIIFPLFVLFTLLILGIFYIFYPWPWYVNECLNYTEEDVMQEMKGVFGNKRIYRNAKVKEYLINPKNGAIHALVTRPGNDVFVLIVPCSIYRKIDYYPSETLEIIE